MNSTHSAKARVRSEEDLQAIADRVIKKVQAQLLAPAAFRFLSRRFGLDHSQPNLRLPAALFTIAYVVATIITKIQEHVAPVIDLARIVLIFIGVFALWTVPFLEGKLFGMNATNILLNCNTDESVEALESWFGRFLSVPRQLAVSIPLSTLLVPTLLLVQRSTTVHFHVTAYLLGVPTLFFVSHGAYCAYSLPELTKVLSRQDMKVFWLNPAETPWLKMLAAGYNTLAFAEAIVLSFCIASMYWFKPWESRQVIALSAVWLALGLAVVVYGFLYPQFYLATAVRRAKQRQAEWVQSVLEPYLVKRGSWTEDERKDMALLLDLNSRLATARQSFLDFKTIGAFITSLVIPIASFVLGRLGILPQQSR